MSAPMCESVRGQWGQVCPDCGQRLPARQPPLTSWKAAKESKADKGNIGYPELSRWGFQGR